MKDLIIDCKQLPCPQPVIKAKEALSKLKFGQKVVLLVDNIAAKENVSRFLANQGLEPLITPNDNGIYQISTIINKEIKNYIQDDENKSILFLKSDKIGNNELGSMLLQGFLTNLKESSNKPRSIICVNEAVLINSDENHVGFKPMQALQEEGIEIISCSACLDYYAKSPIIGRSGNALEILESLFGKAKIISL